MSVIHHGLFSWANKLLLALFYMAFLSACDTSIQQAQPTDSRHSAEEKSSESSDEKNNKEEQEEKTGVIRCAP